MRTKESVAIHLERTVRERAGIEFAPGQVLISVKGGDVIEGGAPLDLIVEKVQTVQSLFYRTAEFLVELPTANAVLRRRKSRKAVVRGCSRPCLAAINLLWPFRKDHSSQTTGNAICLWREKSQIASYEFSTPESKIQRMAYRKWYPIRTTGRHFSSRHVIWRLTARFAINWRFILRMVRVQ